MVVLDHLSGEKQEMLLPYKEGEAKTNTFLGSTACSQPTKSTTNEPPIFLLASHGGDDLSIME
jgi:hypothetical protein